MGRKRITKKQLKEDAFVSASFEAGHFIQENMSRIIMIGVGVIILAGMVWMYVNNRRVRSSEAALAMYQAQNIYANGQYALAASDFDLVAEDHAGTVSGDKALFFAGDAHYKAGDYDQALVRFEQCRDKLSSSDPLLLNAVTGQAACYEQLENLEKAIEYYSQALEMAAFDYQRQDILNALSRVQAMAGRNSDALATMERIITDYPDAPGTGMIIERKAELEARYSTAVTGK
ncbi:MAG: tetratricopeptide repeat protein [Gemmatimonadota bacterium]|nr:tetratricopeptide repeat protein [Gemmatimonadota bacterium]